ncbi:MAG: beta strand repeat-containing protein [Rhizomicrobium sp.]
MTNVTVGSQPFDMTAWDLSDLASGAVTASSSTEVDVSGTALHYVITGSGFTTFDTNGFPTDGTVTGFTETVPGKTATQFTGMSISASAFMGFVNGNNAAGLEAAIFSGNDVLYGRTGDDVLLGYGGNDSFNETKGGNDTVQGGDGNDSISFDAAFTAADSVDGGAGKDTIKLNGDYSAGVVFGAATVTNVEVIKMSDGFSYNLTLNAASDTAGQSLNVDGSLLSAPNHITIDGSAASGALRLAGSTGDDVLIAGSGADNVLGGDGNDTATFSNWAAGSIFNGGNGNDTLVLNGDFSGGLTLDKTEVTKVENFTVLAGHDYDVTLDTSTYHAPNRGTTDFTFDAGTLGASDSLTLDWNPGNQYNKFTVTGGAGNDTIHLDVSLASFSTSGLGSVDLSKGGDDTLIVTNPNHDIVSANYGAAFDGNDVVQNAQIDLNGDYSAGVTMNASDLPTEVNFGGGHNYRLTLQNGNVASGATLQLLGEGLHAGDSLYIDGSAVADGALFVESEAGTTTVIGGAGNDLVDTFGSSAIVHITGGSGNGNYSIANFTTADSIDGGGGLNVLVLAGTAGTYHINGSVIQNIGSLEVNSAMDMVVTGNVVGSGQSMTVFAPSGGGLSFDGSAETTGAFNLEGGTVSGNILRGGAGDDILHGGSAANFLTGNGGADSLICSDHVDTLYYKAVGDSTSATYDTVSYFNPSADKFHLFTSVTGVDASVTTGALSTASFDSDLAAAVGSGQLAAHHAVVFTADSGTLAGDHFLVIDVNGTAGYQAGQDLVIQIANATSLTFTTADFT